MDWGESAPKAMGTRPSLIVQTVYYTPIHEGVRQSSDNLPSVGVVPGVKAPFPNLHTVAVWASTGARVGAKLWRGLSTKGRRLSGSREREGGNSQKNKKVSFPFVKISEDSQCQEGLRFRICKEVASRS